MAANIIQQAALLLIGRQDFSFASLWSQIHNLAQLLLWLLFHLAFLQFSPLKQVFLLSPCLLCISCQLPKVNHHLFSFESNQASKNLLFSQELLSFV